MKSVIKKNLKMDRGAGAMEVTRVENSLTSHARPVDAGRSDGFVMGLTIGIVGLMSATTVGATEMGTDPTWGSELGEGFTSALATLAGLVLSGDVVIGAAALDTARST